MSILPQVKERIMELPVVIWIGNVGIDGFCDIIRCSGIIFNDDDIHITAYVANRYVNNIKQNILDGVKEISLITACISTYESYQLKGEFVSLHQASEREDQESIFFTNRAVAEGIRQGLHGNEVMGPFGIGSKTAITFKVKEIFNQTPKKGTGNKITA